MKRGLCAELVFPREEGMANKLQIACCDKYREMVNIFVVFVQIHKYILRFVKI